MISNPYLIIILSKMCEAVGARYEDINFKEEGWFNKYEWSMDQEAYFKEWLYNFLKDKKVFKSLTGLSGNNEYFKKKFIVYFLFNYSWRYKKGELYE